MQLRGARKHSNLTAAVYKKASACNWSNEQRDAELSLALAELEKLSHCFDNSEQYAKDRDLFNAAFEQLLARYQVTRREQRKARKRLRQQEKTRVVEKESHSALDVTSSDCAVSKKLVCNCLAFQRDILNSGIVQEMTLGQYVETIAFSKVFHFHLITRSQVVHNLFYSYLFNYFSSETNSLPDIISDINEIKIAEKWYLDSYFDGGFSSVMERYYRAMKRLQGNNSATNVTIPLEVFRQTVGPLLESLHHKY